jgi:hypothetical protein
MLESSWSTRSPSRTVSPTISNSGYSLPGHQDPPVNLALVMERAGRNDEAFASYETAPKVWPNYLPVLHVLASLTLRACDRADPRLDGWLPEIGLRGEAQWQAWALGRLATR